MTKISYQLAEMTFVNLAVYDINGRLVESLVNADNGAGFHTLEWKASDVGSGLYFYRLKTSNYTETKKCLILK